MGLGIGMKSGTRAVELRHLAHGRTGDKGDRSNISVIAYRPEFWSVIVEQVTRERVTERFAHRRPTAVERYVLPRLHALNFVLDGVLDGGVNGALNLDSHGKALAFHLLAMTVEVPEALLPLLDSRSPIAGVPR